MPRRFCMTARHRSPASIVSGLLWLHHRCPSDGKLGRARNRPRQKWQHTLSVPVHVPELARTVGLLCKRQRIKGSKPFKTAKRKLGIKSIRKRFGSGGVDSNRVLPSEGKSWIESPSGGARKINELRNSSAPRAVSSKRWVSSRIRFERSRCRPPTRICCRGASTYGGSARRRRWSEPPRVCRRPFGLSYAAMGGCSSMAW